MFDIAGLVQFAGGRPEDRHIDAMLGPAEAGAWDRVGTPVGTLAWRTPGTSAPDGTEGPPIARGPGLTVIADARIDEVSPAGSRPDGTDGNAAPERIAQALSHWGPAATHHLVGDFAFAAVMGDRLILGRDEMSMRPLYFSRSQGGAVRFASSVQVLRDALGRPGPVDSSAVAAFLTGAQLPPGRSFFQDVLRVPPGAGLVISADGEVDVVLRSAAPDTVSHIRAEDDAVDELWRRLQVSVRDRLPPGALALMLSGGADSAAICMALGALGPDVTERSTALTWTFTELRDADESTCARRVAERAGVRLETIPGDDAWPLRDMEGSIPDEEGPFVWPFRALNDRTLGAARAADASVVLTGDRGDYVVGDWVFGDGRTIEAPPVPGYLTPALAEEARRLREAQGPITDGKGGALRRQRVRDWAGGQIAEMNGRAFRRFGLEYADPWSDRRIIDLVTALPPAWVNQQAEPKRILRRLLARLGMSTSDLSRASQESLFRRGVQEREAHRVRALWDDPLAGQYAFVDPGAIRRAIDRYVADGSLPFDLWKPIALEMWLRRVHQAPLS